MNAIAKRLTIGRHDLPGPRSFSEKIIVKTTEFVEIIQVSEILYVKASSNYCTFVCKSGREVMVSKTIGTFEAQLLSNNFIRPHRSYLVNVDEVQRVRKAPYCALCTKDGSEFPVSRARRSHVLLMLGVSESVECH